VALCRGLFGVDRKLHKKNWDLDFKVKISGMKAGKQLFNTLSALMVLMPWYAALQAPLNVNSAHALPVVVVALR
jgi:hypothetical protein